MFKITYAARIILQLDSAGLGKEEGREKTKEEGGKENRLLFEF